MRKFRIQWRKRDRTPSKTYLYDVLMFGNCLPNFINVILFVFEWDEGVSPSEFPPRLLLLINIELLVLNDPNAWQLPSTVHYLKIDLIANKQAGGWRCWGVSLMHIIKCTTNHQLPRQFFHNNNMVQILCTGSTIIWMRCDAKGSQFA